mmetsp:Transcript_62143/g.142289  ORF Transcript_62143/g.142289 Transcript_62143/m.142289 type:complete len:345 (+) Transcript_62143:49-1083(+)
MAVLGLLGTCDLITGGDLARYMIGFAERLDRDTKKLISDLSDMAARGTLTKDGKRTMEERVSKNEMLLPVVLQHLRVTGAAHPRVLTPIVNRLQMFQASEAKAVREQAFFLSMLGSGGSGAGVLRVTMDAEPGFEIEKEAVFATIYTRKHTPWDFYYEAPKALRNTQVPLLLMNARFDGKMGFFGGVVEDEETLQETLCRELREELNYEAGPDLAGFEYLCSHEVPSERMRTHFFAKEVTTEEFFKTERGAFEAVHWGSEVVGLVRVPLFVNETAELPDPTGLPNFLRGNFHQGVIEELFYVVAAKRLISLDKLEAASVAAGLQLSRLVPDEDGEEEEQSDDEA